MSETEETVESLAEQFVEEFGAEEAAAREAAGAAVAFADDYEDVTVERVREAVADADGDGAFPHRFDRAVGEVAAAVDGCSDSRAYRIAGFGSLAADPEQGA
jgi:hypothetical protein